MIEELITACLARRDRLSRERRATLFAALATLVAVGFLLVASFGVFAK